MSNRSDATDRIYRWARIGALAGAVVWLLWMVWVFCAIASFGGKSSPCFALVAIWSVAVALLSAGILSLAGAGMGALAAECWNRIRS